MNATAANLIEWVLPETGLRQWVLTFPFAWRGRLAQDGALLGNLTRIFVETVHTFYAERAARGGQPCVKKGSVTVVQRTSSDSAEPGLGPCGSILTCTRSFWMEHGSCPSAGRRRK